MSMSRSDDETIGPTDSDRRVPFPEREERRSGAASASLREEDEDGAANEAREAEVNADDEDEKAEGARASLLLLLDAIIVSPHDSSSSSSSISTQSADEQPQSSSFVLQCRVAGVGKRSRGANLGTMHSGDVLEFKLEPGNIFDSNALAIHHTTGRIGYLPSPLASVISPLLRKRRAHVRDPIAKSKVMVEFRLALGGGARFSALVHDRLESAFVACMKANHLHDCHFA